MKVILEIQKSILNNYKINLDEYTYDKFKYPRDRIYLSSLNKIKFSIKDDEYIKPNKIKKILCKYNNSHKNQNENMKSEKKSYIDIIDYYQNSDKLLSIVYKDNDNNDISIVNFFTNEEKDKIINHFLKYISWKVSFYIFDMNIGFKFQRDEKIEIIHKN